MRQNRSVRAKTQNQRRLAPHTTRVARVNTKAKSIKPSQRVTRNNKSVHVVQPHINITRSNSTVPELKTSLETSDYKYLTLEKRGATMHVTMNRPELHNAFNEHVIDEISTAFRSITDNINKTVKNITVSDNSTDLIRSVVLTGNGKSFSAGADLSWMQKMAKYSKEDNKNDAMQLYDMFDAIYKTPVPVIAKVNGAALGGGSGLVAACDIAYSVTSAKYGFTEVGLGLVPAVISPFCIDKIGTNNAARFFVTGERFDAVTAQRIGLVQEVYATHDELNAAVDAITTTINNNSPAAVRNAKLLVRDVANLSLKDASTREFTADRIASIRVSDEGQAGLNAFLNKQPAPWKL